MNATEINDTLPLPRKGVTDPVEMVLTLAMGQGTTHTYTPFIEENDTTATFRLGVMGNDLFPAEVDVEYEYDDRTFNFYTIPVGADPSSYHGGFNDTVFKILRAAEKLHAALCAIPRGALRGKNAFGGAEGLARAYWQVECAEGYVRSHKEGR